MTHEDPGVHPLLIGCESLTLNSLTRTLLAQITRGAQDVNHTVGKAKGHRSITGVTWEAGLFEHRRAAREAIRRFPSHHFHM